MEPTMVRCRRCRRVNAEDGGCLCEGPGGYDEDGGNLTPEQAAGDLSRRERDEADRAEIEAERRSEEDATVAYFGPQHDVCACHGTSASVCPLRAIE